MVQKLSAPVVLFGFLACRYTLLHVAAGLGQAQGLQLLLHQPAAKLLVNDTANGDGATPLHAAAMAGSATCVQILLEHGAAGGIAGSGGLLPWQVVRAATDDMQQQLETRLKAAAKAGGGKSSETAMAAAPAGTAMTVLAGSKQTAPNPADGGAVVAATAEKAAAHCPVAAYSAYFSLLPSSEQGRKLDGLARMGPGELAQLDFLNEAAETAIAQAGASTIQICLV
jgi:hypothetical protein